MWVTIFCDSEVRKGTAATATPEQTARQILQPARQSWNVQKLTATNLKVIFLLYFIPHSLLPLKAKVTVIISAQRAGRAEPCMWVIDLRLWRSINDQCAVKPGYSPCPRWLAPPRPVAHLPVMDWLGQSEGPLHIHTPHLCVRLLIAARVQVLHQPILSITCETTVLSGASQMDLSWPTLFFHTSC